MDEDKKNMEVSLNSFEEETKQLLNESLKLIKNDIIGNILTILVSTCILIAFISKSFLDRITLLKILYILMVSGIIKSSVESIINDTKKFKETKNNLNDVVTKMEVFKNKTQVNKKEETLDNVVEFTKIEPKLEVCDELESIQTKTLRRKNDDRNRR